MQMSLIEENKSVGTAQAQWGHYLRGGLRVSVLHPVNGKFTNKSSFYLPRKMIGFYKPKTYRSSRGCCICKAKSSSSRFTDSKRYEGDFQNCFGLHESRTGDICNACVLLVKRWKKLPGGSKKNWNHVVDARGGPNLKPLRLRHKRIRSLAARRLKRQQVLQMKKNLSDHCSGAHSTASSASPTHSSSCSNHSDTDTDTELRTAHSRNSAFSFLDPTYWKRQKVCCGIIYEGRYGEILIDAKQFKPCCSNKKTEETVAS
ncbi:SIN3-HDAC complex-associated factor isoform X1 [Mixophyes fleayi]|uniref:SIN3-HDAC complex-associated factor isoform X1 n=2 Tax=Mixophyes fleayi TaxID=3061075 RepID=UPI003F4D72E1